MAAYARGYFPMGDPREGRLSWYRPDPRTIIPLEGFRTSRAAARRLRAARFAVTFDQDFDGVVAACARRRTTWITPEIRRAYGELHRRGLAHSAEAWQEGHLAGGVYGVRVGAAFMAESMFHRVTDAGMVALAALVAGLRERRFELLDVQFMTPHLKRCGAVEITAQDYEARLRRAVGRRIAWAT